MNKLRIIILSGLILGAVSIQSANAGIFSCFGEGFGKIKSSIQLYKDKQKVKKLYEIYEEKLRTWEYAQNKANHVKIAYEALVSYSNGSYNAALAEAKKTIIANQPKHMKNIKKLVTAFFSSTIKTTMKDYLKSLATSSLHSIIYKYLPEISRQIQGKALFTPQGLQIAKASFYLDFLYFIQISQDLLSVASEYSRENNKLGTHKFNNPCLTLENVQFLKKQIAEYKEISRKLEDL